MSNEADPTVHPKDRPRPRVQLHIFPLPDGEFIQVWSPAGFDPESVVDMFYSLSTLNDD